MIIKAVIFILYIFFSEASHAQNLKNIHAQFEIFQKEVLFPQSNNDSTSSVRNFDNYVDRVLPKFKQLAESVKSYLDEYTIKEYDDKNNLINIKPKPGINFEEYKEISEISNRLSRFLSLFKNLHDSQCLNSQSSRVLDLSHNLMEGIFKGKGLGGYLSNLECNQINEFNNVNLNFFNQMHNLQSCLASSNTSAQDKINITCEEDTSRSRRNGLNERALAIRLNILQKEMNQDAAEALNFIFENKCDESNINCQRIKMSHNLDRKAPLDLVNNSIESYNANINEINSKIRKIYKSGTASKEVIYKGIAQELNLPLINPNEEDYKIAINNEIKKQTFDLFQSALGHISVEALDNCITDSNTINALLIKSDFKLQSRIGRTANGQTLEGLPNPLQKLTESDLKCLKKGTINTLEKSTSDLNHALGKIQDFPMTNVDSSEFQSHKKTQRTYEMNYNFLRNAVSDSPAAFGNLILDPREQQLLKDIDICKLLKDVSRKESIAKQKRAIINGAMGAASLALFILPPPAGVFIGAGWALSGAAMFHDNMNDSLENARATYANRMSFTDGINNNSEFQNFKNEFQTENNHMEEANDAKNEIYMYAVFSAYNLSRLTYKSVTSISELKKKGINFYDMFKNIPNSEKSHLATYINAVFELEPEVQVSILQKVAQNPGKFAAMTQKIYQSRVWEKVVEFTRDNLADPSKLLASGKANKLDFLTEVYQNQDEAMDLKANIDTTIEVETMLTLAIAHNQSNLGFYEKLQQNDFLPL